MYGEVLFGGGYGMYVHELDRGTLLLVWLSVEVRLSMNYTRKMCTHVS